MSTPTIVLPQFQGPFALLLSLIEEKKLSISDIALSEVAEQYLSHIHKSDTISLLDLADFLYVASRLLHLKSKLLVSNTADEDDDDGDTPLAMRLRMYKVYADATVHVMTRVRSGHTSFFGNIKSPPLPSGFYPPRCLSAYDLASSMHTILERLVPLLSLPKVQIAAAISINEKIALIKDRLQHADCLAFEDITNTRTVADTVVSFLALLELIKTREIMATQNGLFSPISVLSYVKK